MSYCIASATQRFNLNAESNALSQEEIVENVSRVVQSGRLALLTSEEPGLLSSTLGDIAVSMMDFGADVIRVDALEANTPADIISTLCSYLGVSGQDLMSGLRIRGETGNPVCMVVDNSECLEGKSLDVLRKLVEGTSCGIGVLLGGEPDLSLYVSDAGIPPSFSLDLDEQGLLMPADHDGDVPSVVSQLPWRHFAAAAGLGLLIWLFWPSGTSVQNGDVRQLELPASASDGVEEDEQEQANDQSALTSQSDSDEVIAEGNKVFNSKGELTNRLNADEEPVQTPRQQSDVVQTTQQQIVVAPPKPAPARSPEPAPAPKPEVKVSAPPKPAPKPPELTGLSAELGYHQEEWILTRAGSEWLMQVALATNEDGARQLLDQIGRSKSVYYRADRNGRSVYIVLAGPWASREAAVAGKMTLPASLRELGPFPRQVSGIQKEITANR